MSTRVNSNASGNNPLFSGRIQLTSNHFKRDAKAILGQQYKSLETLVKTDLPEDTVVFVNVHNQRNVLGRTLDALKQFFSSAKGASRLEDLVINLKIQGDRTRTCFGIHGPSLSYWLSKLPEHFRRVSNQSTAALSGLEATFQQHHDTDWRHQTPLKPNVQKKAGISLTERLRSKAARHLRSKWTSRRSKTISGTLLRMLCSEASTGHTNGNIDINQNTIHLAANYLRNLSPRNPAKALSGALLCHLRSIPKGN